MVAISITNWLRGASSGIEVDTDVVLLTDLNVIASTTINLQGMEVDDSDYHRHTRGEGYAGSRERGSHARSGNAAVPLTAGLATESEDGSLEGSVGSRVEAGTVIGGGDGQ